MKIFNFDNTKHYNYDSEYTSLMTRKCKCGHSVTIYNRKRREICSLCGRFVYLTEKDEFLHKMQRKLIK